MRREEGWEPLPTRQALRELDWAEPSITSELRYFLDSSEMAHWEMRDLRDDEVLDFVRACIRQGDMLVLRQGVTPHNPVNEAVELRRLVAKIESQVRGSLFYRGRQYKLVSGEELAQIPGRDAYEVVSQADARHVLQGIASESGFPSELIAQAAGKLTRDWREPFTQPEGLVLLRRIPIRPSAPKDDEPALTPSQVKTLLDAEKPVTFFARFTDEHGESLYGLTGKLAHGADPDSDMTFSGAGFATVTLKGEKTAGLTLPEDAIRDLVDLLEKRWEEIRGQVDDAWEAKEEVLREVQLEQGKLPELSLEAEKKHTFMLVPPVAMARMHGTYFDTDKCFLLPTATASLEKLVDLYELYPDSEILVVAHTDTSGEESYNLALSAERADSMRAYLRNDVEAWLAWYDDRAGDGKRWGHREDVMMIDALVPEHDFGDDTRVTAYQAWHNGTSADARAPDQPRSKPGGWEALKVDGIMGPKTRRQLVIDYMNLSGTSLPVDTRVVTYGCGEYFPLTEAEGEIDPDAEDDQHVNFDRRVEVFFFDKPFGILPAVPGVAQGQSNAKAIAAAQGSDLYPEWRLRSAHEHRIEPEEASPSVVIEWPDYLSIVLPEDLAIELAADDVSQTISWSEAVVVDGYRRFVFAADPSGAEYTLAAHVGDEQLLLWDEVALDDPENPPVWENRLSDLSKDTDTDEEGPEAESGDVPVDHAPLGGTEAFAEAEGEFDSTAFDEPAGLGPSTSDEDILTAIGNRAVTFHAIDGLD